MDAKKDTLLDLLERMPPGASLVRTADHWQYRKDGRLVSGAWSVRTLLEMEVGRLPKGETGPRALTRPK